MSNYWYIEQRQPPIVPQDTTAPNRYQSGALQNYQQGAQHSLDWNMNRIQSQGSNVTPIKPDAPGQKPQADSSQTLGAIGAGVQGAAQIATGIDQGMQEANSINTQVPSSYTLDTFGTPAYTLAQSQITASGFERTNYGKGLIGRSAAQGFAAGSSTGNPIVAAAGAVIGAGIGAIGQGAIRRRAQSRNDQLRSNLTAAQGRYNRQNVAAGQNYLARQEYEDLQTRSNPYKFSTNYYS